ncbi:tRNA pseudouridine synthase 1 [Marasmius tenuissimus]|uniref:tRNA pseudouridine synthase n=1 Tax=Marasmius tenuissimus TaxID=585030 RepID=A0ABR2ZV69_9AGAR
MEDTEISSPTSSEGSSKRVKHEHESTSVEEKTQADDIAMADTDQGASEPTGAAEGSKGKGKGKAPRDKRNLGRRARGREDTPRDPEAGPESLVCLSDRLRYFSDSAARNTEECSFFSPIRCLHASQRAQPGLPELLTIEGELFKALIAAGAVSKDNADDPVKQRVQNSFNAHTLCDGRKYTYFFPSYLLIPPKPGCALDQSFKEYAASTSRELVYTSDPFWDVPDVEESTAEEDFARKRAWRATPAHMDRLREIVKKFERTHNFHNFTVAQDPKDKSNNRYMKSLEVIDPAVYGETEWIAVELNGQSFMLHQRKMMFALVMICRTQSPSSIIDQLFTLTPVHIPKMPALGLLLEYPVFDLYSKKLDNANGKLDGPSDPAWRDPISFEKYADQMAAFKQKYIYDNMRSIEDRKGLFDAWIRSVDAYGGGDLLYLNPAGTVPEVCVVKKGEKRDKPFREQRKFNLTSFAEDDTEKMRPDEQGDDVEIDQPLSGKEMKEAEG